MTKNKSSLIFLILIIGLLVISCNTKKIIIKDPFVSGGTREKVNDTLFYKEYFISSILNYMGTEVTPEDRICFSIIPEKSLKANSLELAVDNYEEIIIKVNIKDYNKRLEEVKNDTNILMSTVPAKIIKAK